MDRKCERCREVVLGNRVTCVDCERKKKVRNKGRQCGFPKCKTIFYGEGKQNYCPEHKGMPSRERVALAKAMRKE